MIVRRQRRGAWPPSKRPRPFPSFSLLLAIQWGGLVASLARPGGNVTGLSSSSPELGGKWLELFKQAVPRAHSGRVLWQPGHPAHERAIREQTVAARALGLQLQIR